MSRDEVISAAEWAIIFALGICMLFFSGYTGIRLIIPADVLLDIVPIAVLIGMQIYLSMLLAKTKRGAFYGALNPQITLKFFSFFFVLSTLQYCLAAHSGPLRDDLLIRLDHSMGFDWPPFFAWVENHPSIKFVLTLTYESLPFQVLGVFFYACLVFPQRAARFITAVILSTLLTMCVFWLLPAAGPFVAFHHTDLPEALYTDHYLRARDHTLTAIEIGKAQGLISFPSFHVSSAAVLTYFFRRLPVAFGLVVVLNVGMSIAALVIGGHYLCDILGGLVVGTLTLWVIRTLDRGKPEERHIALNP